MSETWRGLITDLAANLLSFSTPTQTHDFGNHINGCGHSKTALVQSFSGLPQIGFFKGFETQKWFRNLARVTIFRVVIFLIGLGNLMICTHDLIVLTKIKDNNLLLRIACVR
jgi:hypothetical protein